MNKNKEVKLIFSYSMSKLMICAKIFLVGVFLLCHLSLIAQERTISGTVTGIDNEPIPGVAVVVKGTSLGTSTDAGGRFTLSIPTTAQTLVISFIGKETIEVTIGAGNVYNVVLRDKTIGLDEIVVIGYGTQKKADLTGSVVRVDMEEKTTIANPMIGSALQGVTAGVNVGAVSDAGDAPDISIRGKTSLSASDAPLIVLDGIIYNGSLSDININDVESIDVLKDASAAAVYGARSANGVMIITTKKGKTEKPVFNINTYFGYQDFTPSPKRPMNGDEFAIRLVDFYYQQSLYAWYATKPTSDVGKPIRGNINDRNYVSTFLRTQEEVEHYLANKEVNWMKEIEQPAPIQNYNISVSGKTEKTNYYLSAAYLNQKGKLKNDQFNRTNFHINLENKITNWMTLGTNASFSARDASGIEADLGTALIASPLVEPYTPQGTYPIQLAMETGHPLSNTVADNTDLNKSLFLLGYTKIEIPKIKGLIYDFNYSTTINNSRSATFYPSTSSGGQSGRGSANKSYSESISWIFNNILTYNKVLGRDHSINTTLLFSREGRNGDGGSLRSQGFDNEVLGYNSMQLGAIQTVNTSAWKESSISYMARLNYNFKSKYLFTGTIRRDGFSGFGSKNKTAVFPSLSFGWVTSEEAFFKNQNVINSLKFRLSVGANGNQGIGRYSSKPTMGTNAYIFESTTAIGLFPNKIGNDDLGWESTLSYNLGIDFGVLQNRISGTIDMYIAKTTNVLVRRSIPGSTGYSSVWTNIGAIDNKGIELSLNTVNIEKGNLNWKTNFVFSINRDKISKLYGGAEDRDLGNSWFVGEPISAIYDYKSDYTIWTEQELYNGEIKFPITYPGHWKIEDLNGDDDIDATNDRTIIGYKTPNFRWSMGNNFTYKNLTLSVFLNSIMGSKKYYLDNMGDDAITCFATGTADAPTQYIYRYNQLITRQYWTPDNGVTNSPSLFFLPYRNVWFWQPKSFVRLQDVSLTYNFPKNLLSTYGIANLQVYVSGKNLYLWTKWEGYDPEFAGGSNSRLMRNIVGGLRLTF